MSDTPDLLNVLAAIRDEAQTTKRKLSTGLAVNGASSLQKIVWMAGDALEDAEGSPQEEVSG